MSTTTTPAVSNTRWAVRIQFDDGEYENSAWAASPERAFRLALIDARLGSAFGSYLGRVLGWAAAPLGEEVPA